MNEMDQLITFIEDKISVWKMCASTYPLNTPVRSVYEADIAVAELILAQARAIHKVQARGLWDRLVGR